MSRGLSLLLAPGFSRVWGARAIGNGFNRFRLAKRDQAVETASSLANANTGLKPGANERLQETEMRPCPDTSGKCGQSQCLN